MPKSDVVIVGGGAAGFFAALAAAEANPRLSITILEKSEHTLAKVRISGGGRCNVTTAQFDPALLVSYYPRGGKELRGPFTRFGPRDTVAWFEARGVKLKTEADGRIFPTSDRSQTIIDCLEGQALRAGVRIERHAGVRQLRPGAMGWELLAANAESYQARKVLLAPGGASASAYALAGGLGHTILTPVPSLFSFKIPDPRLQGLAGVSVANSDLQLEMPQVRLPIQASGPLLVTHWGLSGPAVLRLSAWGARPLAEQHYQAPLRVNWLPGHDAESLLQPLRVFRQGHLRQKALTNDPTGSLPARLWKALAAGAGVDPELTWAEVSNPRLRSLAEALTRGVFQIQGKGVFKDEFVTCGGVSLKEVDFKSMQSRLHPGLHFAGEYLDIDGLTGGFNFQAAWTTGWIAGKALAD